VSFNVDINQVLQFGYNVFASATPLVWLFVGGAFGLFMLGGLLRLFRG
jgi:hypothetical protein